MLSFGIFADLAVCIADLKRAFISGFLSPSLADRVYNLDDNILDTLDDQTVNEIMAELQQVMRSANAMPGAPLEMTLPMIRDIFMQILYQKTGLAPAPMGM